MATLLVLEAEQRDRCVSSLAAYLNPHALRECEKVFEFKIIYSLK